MSEQETTEPIIIYGTPTCPMVGPVKRMMSHADVPYEYINIHQDDDARQRVRDINQGNESVPTIIFPDDSSLTEPSAGELKSKLESIGYDVPLTALLMGNMWNLFLVGGIVLAILRVLGII